MPWLFSCLHNCLIIARVPTWHQATKILAELECGQDKAHSPETHPHDSYSFSKVLIQRRFFRWASMLGSLKLWKLWSTPLFAN